MGRVGRVGRVVIHGYIEWGHAEEWMDGWMDEEYRRIRVVSDELVHIEKRREHAMILW